MELDSDIIDFIDTDSDNAGINAEFKIYGDEVLYEVGYTITFSKVENGAVIEREFLNCSVNQDGNRTNKNIFMDYKRSEPDVIFKPQKRLDELIGRDREKRTDLIVARKMAEKSNCSYIFGENSREVFNSETSDEFSNYTMVINALFNYALKDLFVIKSSHSGMISANFLLPMAFRVEKEKMGMKGDFVIPLTAPAVLDAERKNLLIEIVDQINTVLYTIIPKMKIEIKDYGKQAMDSGEDGWKVELMSVRGDKKPISIRMESYMLFTIYFPAVIIYIICLYMSIRGVGKYLFCIYSIII